MLRKTCLISFALLGFCLLPISVSAQQETWTVNFRDTEIAELIRFVAEATGRTIVVDPAVRGSVLVKLQEATKVTVEIVWKQLLLSVSGGLLCGNSAFAHILCTVRTRG